MTMSFDDVFYSTTEDVENLQFTERDEALQDYVDQWGTAGERIQPGEQVMLYLWRRDKLPSNVGGYVDCLELLLEAIDEEWGNPEEATEPNDAMRKAEKLFTVAVRAAYVPWRCSIHEQVKVDLHAWCEENEDAEGWHRRD